MTPASPVKVAAAEAKILDQWDADAGYYSMVGNGVSSMVFKRHVAASIILLAIGQCASAVVVLGGRDAAGNLNNSGSNLNPAPFNLDSYEGSFSSYIGTPIAPHYFATAAHIGGAAGQTISIDGSSFTVVAEHTENDLAIWETDPAGPAFPSSVIAPIYTGSDEVGNDMVVVGRGGPRGPVITINGTDRGYYWTSQASSAPYSWGEQSVGTIALDSNNAQYLAFSFAKQTDSSGAITNPDQGALSPGDSGGGVFVRDPSDGIYKLAGISYGADGPFNVNPRP